MVGSISLNVSVLFDMNSGKCVVLFCIKPQEVSQLFHISLSLAHLWTCLKQASYITIRKKILKQSFLISNNFYLLILMSTWQFHLSNRQGMGPAWAISSYFVYSELLVWAFPQSDSLNLTHCKISSLLLCILIFACLYGWSNSNIIHIKLVHRTIRTVLGH